MGVNTNSFENYKNSVEPSEKGGFLSKLQGFGIDSLGGLDSFMGKDIINANKLLKSFKGFNLSSILGNLGDFFKNLAMSALDMLKDMGMDALRSLENASINFISNLAEDLYNNVRASMYIPDSAFAVTLRGLYFAGADLAYNNHYIRKSALQRDWAVSLEFIDEQYGIDYNLRDYKDLESDLSICANNSCVNNLYYIYSKLYTQLTDLKKEIVVDSAVLKEYTEPIIGYKQISYEEALVATNLYLDIGGEKTPIDMGENSHQGVEFVQDHPNYTYYTETIIGYVGIENGLYSKYKYETDETKEIVESRYRTYLSNNELIRNTERMMVSYFKTLIVRSYTYLNATSVQKFFSDFNTVLLPKYYGVTDDKYNGVFSFNQNDCLIMMPDYNGNDVSKSDKYTQSLANVENNKYLLSSGARSDASIAATEAEKTKALAKSASEAGNGPWSSETGYTVNSAVESGTKTATAKIKQFRANALEKTISNQNATYGANIQNGLVGTLQSQSKGLWNRSGQGINAKQDGKTLSSMYDRDVVKLNELVGSLSDLADEIDFLNKDTKYIVLRNKNIKQIYALLSNVTIYGNDRMVNDYFYKRCKIKTMNTLNQSLSKVGSILGSTYAIQSIFDLESAVDSSAYVYIKKVENYLLNPKEHSYYGLDTMFNPENNMWTQFGDYFKQAYNWDDSVGNDPDLEEMIEKLANATPSDSSKVSSSDIDPVADLSSENGSNPTTFSEILEELKTNKTASDYVDNVLRFISSIPALELRDMLNKYLTMFYKFMEAREFNTEPYFSTLLNSMSGISNIKHYNDLNNTVFSKSTHKSLLANAKFLISIYALKNSYKYFLEDQNDSNKEELTKLYNLVFAMGAAEIQMNGTISALSKYDREQLNSLVKQNFFTSINHLKSINDKNNPMISGAPKYKDSLTITFGNSFDIRGVTGYSFDNNRLLYVPEQSIGDWNSVGVADSEEIGAFFCKSNINNDSSGIYRRAHNSESLTKIDVYTSGNYKITNHNFIVISLNDTGNIYFGLIDKGNDQNITETLFVYDSINNKICGVSGFNDDPNDYDFKADVKHDIFIATSKVNKGCYYSKLGEQRITKGTSAGGNHEFLTLNDNSVVVYSGKSSQLMYFDASGNYVNTCDIGVTSIYSVLPSSSDIMLNIEQTITTPEGETQTQTISIPNKIHGLLVSTEKSIIHCVASTTFDPVTGQASSSKTLEKGKTYRMNDEDREHFIFEDMTVISSKTGGEIVYAKLIPESSIPTVSSGSSFSDIKFYDFTDTISAVNNTYKPTDGTLQPPSNIISYKFTLDGIYYLINRVNVETNELYFLPNKYNSTNPPMSLLHSGLSNSIKDFKVITTKTPNSESKTPNIIIYPNNSMYFISISRGYEITATLIESKFTDIDSDNPSADSFVIKENKSDWKDLSVTNDNRIYLQHVKYGLILFDGNQVHEIMKYSNLVGGDITKADLKFDFVILKAKNVTFLANKSSGNKYIKNAYGIFKSTDNGISRSYVDENAFHDGDIGGIAYDIYHNCVYFTTYRDKTVFDYDFLATIAAFDIDAYISKLSYYQLTKLAKTLLELQTSSIGDNILDLLSAKNDDGSSFKYTIDELLNKVIDLSLKVQESSQKSLLGSTLFADIANYKAAADIFDDVGSDEFNEDMTKEFIMKYPGEILTADEDESNKIDYSIPLSLDEIGDVNGDGKVDELDRNWYLAMLNGGEITTHTTLDDWFNNLANGIYGNGLGSLISLRLSYNEQIKLLANFRTTKVKFLISGKALSEDEVDDSVDGPNSIVDPSTDESSKDYKWYNKNKVDFATYDFENSDENGESEW